MTPEALFRLCNSLALAGWLLLIFLGWKRWVSGLVTAVFVPLILALLYVFLLLFHWGESRGSFNSLSGVASLFQNPWLLLGGWIHYLAFDLFIGSWQVRDAAQHRIPHWAVVPCLMLTFLFGPAGLLLYLLLRLTLRRQLTIAPGAVRT